MAKQISKALELRKKYRLAAPQVLPPQLVGFDPANRDGIPLNGLRCDQLLGDICSMGFDWDEAQHDNVCVQVRPGDTAVHQYNKATCEANEMLANLEVDNLQYGTLSHSHLHQCLKNINGKAKAIAPAGFCSEGVLQLELVKSKDPALAKACERGLTWEVLHWSVRDEPGALELIQAACNRKAASQLRETEMQGIARLSAICSSLQREQANRLSFTAARDHLAMTLPELAISDWCSCARISD